MAEDDLFVWVEFEGMKDEVDCSSLRNVSQLRRAIKTAFDISKAAPYIQVTHPVLGPLNAETSMSIALSEGGGDAATPLLVQLVDPSTDTPVPPSPKTERRVASASGGYSSGSESDGGAGDEDTGAKRKKLVRTPSKVRIPRVFMKADKAGGPPPMPNTLGSSGDLSAGAAEAHEGHKKSLQMKGAGDDGDGEGEQGGASVPKQRSVVPPPVAPLPPEAAAPVAGGGGAAEGESDTDDTSDRSDGVSLRTSNRLEEIMGDEFDEDTAEEDDGYVYDESEMTASEFGEVGAKQSAGSASDDGLSDGEEEVGEEEKARKRAKMVDKRTKVAREILETESKYVADLDITIRHYLQPMQAQAATPSGSISAEDVKSLFGNIRVIHMCNSQLLEDVEKRMSDWDVNKTLIGDVFLGIGQFLKLYNQYVVHYAKARALLKELIKDESFSTFLSLLENANSDSKHSLGSFLIMPVQRIPRYIMLVKELYQNTWADHPDHENLKNALTQLESVAMELEMKQSKASNISQVMDIQSKMRYKKQPVSLVQPGREYVRDGKVNVSEKGLANTLRQRHAFLFSDLLVICRLPQKKENVFQLKERIALSSLSGVRKTEKGIRLVVNPSSASEAATDRKEIFLSTDGGADEKEWLDELVLCFTKVMMSESVNAGKKKKSRSLAPDSDEGGKVRSKSVSSEQAPSKKSLAPSMSFDAGPHSSPLKRRRNRASTGISQLLKTHAAAPTTERERKKGGSMIQMEVRNPLYGKEGLSELRPTTLLLRKHPRLMWITPGGRYQQMLVEQEAERLKTLGGAGEEGLGGRRLSVSLPLSGLASEQQVAEGPEGSPRSPSTRKLVEKNSKGRLTPRKGRDASPSPSGLREEDE
eukprot:TRINITY_DN1134_c0_g1_i1.p1 TRINITY_DN1134_c0_g1~~TRINITY_DN1134_c0_g1_i1.p1  ORF type:complete len:871 (-),score=341.46 TRINITY_DN1134_c0_g1_i1:500-3112(-)